MALMNGIGLCLTVIVALSTAAIAKNGSSPLVNFQVSQPLTLPKDVHKCEVPLISRVFGNSYYDPEIVQYTPPTDCGTIGTWAGISLNWTATSNGTQYDRLAGVTLGHVEIWRTSTSEPTPSGIIWTALKDVTKYLSLFSIPGTLIVDLNNILDPGSGLDGEYDVQLSATFYQSDSNHPEATAADLIVPLSTLQNGQSNVFTVPPAGNTNVTLPRNAVTAVVEVQASANYEEEFWYFNLPDEYLQYVPPGTTYGKGSFREVRVLVDGLVAGIVFPYPVIFTGAYIPPLWRPIVAYGAYDLPTYNVDLTPFIPILADGAEHLVTLDVVSDEADHTLNPNWYLSGNIQVGLNPSGEPTTGRITQYEAPLYASSLHSMKKIDENSYAFNVTASHSLHIVADITPGGGRTNQVVWRQDMQFTNAQLYLNSGAQMIVIQSSNGYSISSYNDLPALTDSFNFPLSIDFDITANLSASITTIEHEYNRAYLPSLWESMTHIQSAQLANGTYTSATTIDTNNNNFSYWDDKSNSYYRQVESTNNIITKDKEGGTLSWDFGPVSGAGPGTTSFNSSDDLTSFAPPRIPGHRPVFQLH